MSKVIISKYKMENKTPKIKQLFVEGHGWVYHDDKTPIEHFTVNGEMALVSWYRQGKREYNGKYVSVIEYF